MAAGSSAASFGASAAAAAGFGSTAAGAGAAGGVILRASPIAPITGLVMAAVPPSVPASVPVFTICLATFLSVSCTPVALISKRRRRWMED